MQVRCHVVAPLAFVELGAVGRVFIPGAIVHMESGRDKAHRRRPVPDLYSPVRICHIAGISSEASSSLEKSTVGHAVLIGITIRGWIVLPLQSSSTGCIVCLPSCHIKIEGICGDTQPRVGACSICAGPLSCAGRDGFEVILEGCEGAVQPICLV